MEVLNNSQIKKVKIATSRLDAIDTLPTLLRTSTGNVIVVSNGSNLIQKVTKENTVYCICYPFNLNGNTLRLPKNTSLEFVGGSISNGTIIGNNSAIIADTKVFNNVNLQGTWRCVGNVGWWAKGSSTIEYTPGVFIPENFNDHDNIQLALDSSFRELIFPPKLFYTATTLTLSKEKKIVMQGSTMKLSLAQCKDTIHNSAVLYTDKDVDLLVIAVKENGDYHASVTIEGGSFDVSRCINDNMEFIPYTHSVIKVKADDGEKLWGLTINTSVKGTDNCREGVGINLNPDRDDTKIDEIANGTRYYNLEDFGYVTQVRIYGSISHFGTGLRVKNYETNKVFYNWCTDVQVDCNFSDCHEAIYSNTEIDIRGMIQAAHFYNTVNNGAALITLDSDMACVQANIYDIGTVTTQQYALRINQPNSRITTGGLFKAFLAAQQWQNSRQLSDMVAGYTNTLV